MRSIWKPDGSSITKATEKYTITPDPDSKLLKKMCDGLNLVELVEMPKIDGGAVSDAELKMIKFGLINLQKLQPNNKLVNDFLRVIKRLES